MELSIALNLGIRRSSFFYIVHALATPVPVELMAASPTFRRSTIVVNDPPPVIDHSRLDIVSAAVDVENGATYATILEVAGIDRPPELVGHSLLGPPGRRGTFCEFHRGAYPYQAPAYMWRTETAKLILYFPAEVDQPLAQLDRVEGELYDLEDDPHEWHNRYHDPHFAGLRESLTRELLMHLATIWSTYPRPTSNT